MSKRRVVITAVLAGQSQSEVARTYGVSQGWVSKLMARYRDEGEAAFEPGSRAPLNTPSATPATTVELIVRLRKQLLEAAWTPAPKPSAGTWSIATTSPCPGRRSTGPWSATAR
jgi:transposase